jgi:hypothetical protein
MAEKGEKVIDVSIYQWILEDFDMFRHLLGGTTHVDGKNTSLHRYPVGGWDRQPQSFSVLLYLIIKHVHIIYI